MPFGPYKDFDDCVSKNKDKKSPEGFCAYLHKQITGDWPSEKKYRKGTYSSPSVRSELPNQASDQNLDETQVKTEDKADAFHDNKLIVAAKKLRHLFR